jgi:hypothetical protein
MRVIYKKCTYIRSGTKIKFDGGLTNMKKEVLSISEFLQRETEPFSAKIERHFKKYNFVYKVIGTTIFVFAVSGGIDVAFAADGLIDKEGRALYKELIIGMGRWLILGRGAWEIISAVLKQDFEGAKKNVIGYSIAYACLLGLPHLFDKIDDLFDRFGA